MASTTTFKTLKAKIVTILQADTDLDSDSVFNHEPDIDKIGQDPFATVVPSGNEADFGSTLENKREFAFLIRVFVERDARGNSAAEVLLTDIIDRLMDRFDEDYTLTGSALTAMAAPSAWGYVFGTKSYRTAEILLTVKVWYDIST